MGDVACIAPTVMFHTTTQAIGTPGHSWQHVAQNKSPLAKKGMLFACKGMAGAAIGLAGGLLTVALICAGIVHFGGAGEQVTLSVLEGSAIGGFFFRLFA